MNGVPRHRPVTLYSRSATREASGSASSNPALDQAPERPARESSRGRLPGGGASVVIWFTCRTTRRGAVEDGQLAANRLAVVGDRRERAGARGASNQREFFSGIGNQTRQEPNLERSGEGHRYRDLQVVVLDRGRVGECPSSSRPSPAARSPARRTRRAGRRESRRARWPRPRSAGPRWKLPLPVNDLDDEPSPRRPAP